MKSLKMLMMAALTFLSVSVFAQAATNTNTKASQQKKEKAFGICFDRDFPAKPTLKIKPVPLSISQIGRAFN